MKSLFIYLTILFSINLYALDIDFESFNKARLKGFLLCGNLSDTLFYDDGFTSGFLEKGKYKLKINSYDEKGFIVHIISKENEEIDIIYIEIPELNIVEFETQYSKRRLLKIGSVPGYYEVIISNSSGFDSTPFRGNPTTKINSLNFDFHLNSGDLLGAPGDITFSITYSKQLGYWDLVNGSINFIPTHNVETISNCF